MSLILPFKCLVLINFYYLLSYSEVESLSVREQDTIHAVDEKRRTSIQESYADPPQQEPLFLVMDDGAMPKTRKKKKRYLRKKKHLKLQLENIPTEKKVIKKKRATHMTRNVNDFEEPDKKKKTVRYFKKFIKTPIREVEDSAESMENTKKMSPVDIVVHIKMNEMN